MNKKFSFLILTLLILNSFPFIVSAQTFDNGEDAIEQSASERRRTDSKVRENIRDLDNDIVRELPIPVLFGVTTKNLTKNFGDPRAGHAHEGLDILAPEGTPIVSPTEAVVVQTGVWTGAGNFVSTAAPGDETFVYMHLSKIADISAGDVLKPGDLIGYVGHTGNAIAASPHLHFEIRDEDGEAIDPYPRLTQVFDLEDKIEYLSAILDDVNNEDELAELLVTKFRSEFNQAIAQKIELPKDILQAIEKFPAPIVTVKPASTGILRVGSRGPEVVAMQTLLIKKGIGTALRIKADGAFGPMTKQALIDYQRSVGLTPDGVYGPKSKEILSK